MAHWRAICREKINSLSSRLDEAEEKDKHIWLNELDSLLSTVTSTPPASAVKVSISSIGGGGAGAGAGGSSSAVLPPVNLVFDAAERKKEPLKQNYANECKAFLLGSQAFVPEREARRVYVKICPSEWRRISGPVNSSSPLSDTSPIFHFFNSVLNPRYVSGLVRTLCTVSSAQLFLEFASSGLASAVIRDLNGVIPVTPGTTPSIGALGLVLEATRGAPAPNLLTSESIDKRGLSYEKNSSTTPTKESNKRAREAGV